MIHKYISFVLKINELIRGYKLYHLKKKSIQDNEFENLNFL